MIQAFDPLFNSFEPEEEEKRRDPLMALMESYRAPERPKLDAYSEILNQIPRREDHQLGTGGKIGGAVLAGLAGLTAKSGKEAAEFGTSLRDRPYKQALEDFSLQAKGAKEAAELETEVVSEREKLFSQMFDMQDKITDNDRADKETSIRNFRAKTMDIYLKDKAKRDAETAKSRAATDARRAAAAEKSAGAAASRAASYGKHVDNMGKKAPKPPTEAAKAVAKKQAMDYLGAIDPRFNKMIQRDDYFNIIGYNATNAAADQKTFEEFVTRVEQMMAQSLGSMPDDDLSDIDAEFEE